MQGYKVYIECKHKGFNRVETLELGRKQYFKTVRDCYYNAHELLDALCQTKSGVVGGDLKWVYKCRNQLYDYLSEREKCLSSKVFVEETETYIFKTQIDCY